MRIEVKWKCEYDKNLWKWDLKERPYLTAIRSRDQGGRIQWSRYEIKKLQ